MRLKRQKLTLLTLIVSVVAIATFSACKTTKGAFLNSSVVPAARGMVKVSPDSNNNYAIKVWVDYLAAPNRLMPPKNAYVIWLISENNAAKNIGQVNITKTLRANFKTVSSFPPTKIMITAENDPLTTSPSNSDIILITDYLK